MILTLIRQFCPSWAANFFSMIHLFHLNTGLTVVVWHQKRVIYSYVTETALAPLFLIHKDSVLLYDVTVTIFKMTHLLHLISSLMVVEWRQLFQWRIQKGNFTGGGGGKILQRRDRVKRAERLTAWGPRTRLEVPIGSRGKIPGGGAGGRAAASPWAPGLSIWNAKKGSPVTLFFFHKMIDGSPKTEKSTLCHSICNAQQTIEIICLHGKQFGDCLRWRPMMNDTSSTKKSTWCCNISLDYTRNKENYLFAWKTIWDCLWCGGWLAPGGGCLRTRQAL